MIIEKSLKESNFCGCYNCLYRFLTEDIKDSDLTDFSEIICPNCNELTVIPMETYSGLSYFNLINLNRDLIDSNFLKKMIGVSKNNGEFK